MEGKLNAQLSRLLAVASSSPYWRYAESSLFAAANRENKTVYEFVSSECFKAYSFEKLPELMRDFLSRCDRSLKIEYELYDGRVPKLNQEEQDGKVIETMAERGFFNNANN